MKKRVAAWLKWAGGAVALLAVAVVVGEAAGWPFLRSPLQQMATRAAGVPVRMEGDFRVRFFYKPVLQVQRLNVAAAGALDVPHLLDVQQLQLGWRWRDLLHWLRHDEVRIHRLQASTLEAFAVRNADGRSSWPAGDKGAPAGTEAEPPPVVLPRIANLQLGRGRIVVDDAPLQTQLEIGVMGGEGEALGNDSKAGYSITAKGRHRALPLDLQMRTGGALPLLQAPSAANGNDGRLPFTVEGTAGAAWLRFEGSAASPLDERRLQGDLRFRGPSLARVGAPLGLTLPDTPPFDLRGTLAHDAGVWQMKVQRATIGRSVLNGEFSFDTRATPPRLEGRLGGALLALADLGPALGADDDQVASRVFPQTRFDLPSLRAMNADVQVAIDVLDLDTDSLAPLRGLRMRVGLDKGVLHLDSMRASVAGGDFSGSTRLDSNVDPALWTLNLKLTKVDMAAWIRGLRSESGEAKAPDPRNTAAVTKQRQQARQGGDQPAASYVTGVLNGALQARGKGRSVAEVMGTLDGRAQVALREGTLSHLATEALGLDVAEGLGVLVRGDRPLPLRCAWLDLAVQNGVVVPRQAVIDNADTQVLVSGQVNLRNEALAVRMTARPKDFSPFTLRSPVLVGGTLADPNVSVASEALAAKALGAVALGAIIGPAAALLPFVDLGVGEQDDACAAPIGTGKARAAAPAASASAR